MNLRKIVDNKMALFLIGFLLFFLIGITVSSIQRASINENQLPLSEEVEAYTSVIETIAETHEISQYTHLIKAVMMQESAGQGPDPMQASEGEFNLEYPQEIQGIQDSEYSIEVGVKELKKALEMAEVRNEKDIERISLALQGYNFGSEYITWALDNYGGYSMDNSWEYASIQSNRLGWESYGDADYVSHVLRYYRYK